MAKITAQDFEAAIRKEFSDSTSISLLGGTNRRNSYTFKVAGRANETRVIKILKKGSGVDSKINDEKKSLETIEDRTDIRVSRLLASGELKVKTQTMTYLIFPYYEGDVLSQLASHGKCCTEDEVEKFIKSVGETIVKLGSVGIIHQDIKPDNIIRLKNGEYIVLDLGISRFTTLEPSFVKQQGPAAYLSMEQVELGSDRNIANQRRMSFLSDLNSLGIVALNLLLGEDFHYKWEVDRRRDASARIRNGEIVEIQNTQLRELIASLLEASPSKRLLKLSTLLDLSPFTMVKPISKRYWSLHKSTGLNFLKDYANENDKSLGLVLSAETVISVAKTTHIVESLSNKDWEIAVDPSTHKLLYMTDHHAYLKNRQYYYDDLYEERFFDMAFTSTFVSQVVEFERSLNPTLYISPYFYIKNAQDKLISVGLNLYDETRKQLNNLGDNRPLAMGLSISKSLITNEQNVDALADQIVMNRSFDMVYLNLELTKNDNTPLKDGDYLRGVKNLVERLAVTKQVLVAQIDQSSLGLLTSQTVGVAINPSVSYRKNDIDGKLKEEKPEVTFGPKSQDIRHRVYIRLLMNDLDVSRDLNTPAFAKLDKSANITNSSTSKYYSATLDVTNSEARNKQFTYEFSLQADKLTQPSKTQAIGEFKKMLSAANDAYAEIDKAGIKLDGNQTGDFLEVWEEVFLKP